MCLNLQVAYGNSSIYVYDWRMLSTQLIMCVAIGSLLASGGMINYSNCHVRNLVWHNRLPNQEPYSDSKYGNSSDCAAWPIRMNVASYATSFAAIGVIVPVTRISCELAMSTVAVSMSSSSQVSVTQPLSALLVCIYSLRIVRQFCSVHSAAWKIPTFFNKSWLVAIISAPLLVLSCWSRRNQYIACGKLVRVARQKTLMKHTVDCML